MRHVARHYDHNRVS
ncbi:comF family domain protein, partial [Vibrio cholerae HC-56A2]